MSRDKKRRKKIKNPSPEKGKKIKGKNDGSGPSSLDYPIFCFKYLQKGYDFDPLEDEYICAFTKQLHRLSQLTWQIIQTSPRHGLGSEKIVKDSIKANIPPFLSEDVTLLAFRYIGKLPFVGYRNEAILHILWIEKQFGELYNHC